MSSVRVSRPFQASMSRRYSSLEIRPSPSSSTASNMTEAVAATASVMPRNRSTTMSTSSRVIFSSGTSAGGGEQGFPPAHHDFAQPVVLGRSFLGAADFYPPLGEGGEIRLLEKPVAIGVHDTEDALNLAPLQLACHRMSFPFFSRPWQSLVARAFPSNWPDGSNAATNR